MWKKEGMHSFPPPSHPLIKNRDLCAIYHLSFIAIQLQSRPNLVMPKQDSMLLLEPPAATQTGRQPSRAAAAAAAAAAAVDAAAAAVLFYKQWSDNIQVLIILCGNHLLTTLR